jgi:hypothetical protein
MINEERIGKYLQESRRASGICLEEVRKYTKTLVRFEPAISRVQLRRVTVQSFINDSTALCWVLAFSSVS